MTRTPLSRSKGQRSTCRGCGILWGPPAQLVGNIIKRCSSVFTDIVVNLANLSFEQGKFPTNYKAAVITPLLTKSRHHVSKVCRSAHFHLRTLRHIRAALTDDMAKTVAVSLIHSNIDYANSLIHGSINVRSCSAYRTQLTWCY